MDAQRSHELNHYPALRSCWVALYSGDLTTLGAAPNYSVILPSGVVVVDADPELDTLCNRLSDEQRTALEIIYNA